MRRPGDSTAATGFSPPSLASDELVLVQADARVADHCLADRAEHLLPEKELFPDHEVNRAKPARLRFGDRLFRRELRHRAAQ